MARPEANQPEIRRIRRLLRETVRLAEHASLTGSLDKGSRIAIRQYNHIREHLQDIGAIPDDLFQDLDEDEATFDELGIVCGMLEGYLVDDEEATAGGKGGPRVQVGMVGLKELDDLKEIGRVIRESLPEFFREHIRHGEHGRHAERESRNAFRDAEREAARDSQREARDAAREEVWAARGGEPSAHSAADMRAEQMDNVTNQIRDVGERLRQPDLGDGQRAELLQRLDGLMTALQQLAGSERS